MLATRFGIVRTVMGGGALYTVGLVIVALSESGGMLTLGNALAGGAIGVAGFSAVFGAVGQAAPPEKRTMVLAITAAGGSLGQFSVVPFGHVMFELFGWRVAMLILAALASTIVLFALGLRRPATQGSAAGSGGPVQSTRAALAEAFGHRGYVLLTIGFFVCGFHVAFVGTHMPNFLADKAVAVSILGRELSPAALGALSVAVIGLFNIVGTLAAGFVGGAVARKDALVAIYAARAAIIVYLLLAPIGGTSILVFSMVFGLLYLSTVPITSGLIGYLFGPTHMGTLYGFVFFSHQLGGFLGAWGGGYLFDRTGSYDIMWWASAALGVFAALVHWPIVEKPVARAVAA